MQSKVKVGDIITANKNYVDFSNEVGIQYKVLAVDDFLGDVGIFVFDPRSGVGADHRGSNGIFLENEVDLVEAA